MGLVLLGAELLALSAVGYVVSRVVLRQMDDRLALAQGLVVGPALWGLTVNFVLHVLPGRPGAAAGWVIVIALVAGLVWRARQHLKTPARTLLGFGVAGVAVFWVALASRQLFGVPDELLHSMIPATIEAGSWPPTLAWNPGVNLAYHHGIDLLVGLLAPPLGPDLAFTTEVVGAYAWTSLILLTVALLVRHGAWAGTLALAPLLLAAGTWTLVFGEQPSLLQVPIPIGGPEAGLRASLGGLYWPPVELPWSSEHDGVPTNIMETVIHVRLRAGCYDSREVGGARRRNLAIEPCAGGYVGISRPARRDRGPNPARDLGCPGSLASAQISTNLRESCRRSLPRHGWSSNRRSPADRGRWGVYRHSGGKHWIQRGHIWMASGSTDPQCREFSVSVTRRAGSPETWISSGSRIRRPANPAQLAGTAPCSGCRDFSTWRAHAEIQPRPTRRSPIRRTRPQFCVVGFHTGAECPPGDHAAEPQIRGGCRDLPAAYLAHRRGASTQAWPGRRPRPTDCQRRTGITRVRRVVLVDGAISP